MNYFEQEKDMSIHDKYLMWDEYFKDRKYRIAICIPTYDLRIYIPTMVSLSTMWKPYHYYLHKHGPTIGVNRNLLVERALADRETTHILFVDTDMILPHDLVARFLMHMENEDIHMMTGIYFQKSIPYRSTQFMSFDHEKFTRLKVGNYPEGELVRIHSSGAGALLIKREVFEQIDPPYFKFKISNDGLTYLGEDIYFFEKTEEAGLNLYVDTSIICQHINGTQFFPLMFEQEYLTIGKKTKEIGENQERESVKQWLGL